MGAASLHRVGARPVRKASSTESSMCMSQTDSIQIFHLVQPQVQDAVSASGDKSFVAASSIPNAVPRRRMRFLEAVEDASAQATLGALRNALQGLVACERSPSAIRKAETDGAARIVAVVGHGPNWSLFEAQPVTIALLRQLPPAACRHGKCHGEKRTRNTQCGLPPDRAFSDCFPVAPKRDQRLLKPFGVTAADITSGVQRQ